ncbi:MAG: hypothetical protein ACUVQ2_03195 [Dissulfurimicrobium sp.]|uniref:hypothetical protein n=1 Tax=Dissulfurimicrobium sp. TaxID=2022436 RepID=UPI00404AC774
MRGLKFFIWFISVFSLGSTTLAADSIREGKWEFITQTQMTGMPKMPGLSPGVKLPPGVNMSKNDNGIQMTATKCVTKDDGEKIIYMASIVVRE